MIFRNVSFLAIIAAIGFLFFLVHLFKSKDHNHKCCGSGHFGFILLFLVAGAFAFLIAARSGVASPLRGVRSAMPGILVFVVLVFIVLLLVSVFHKKEGRGRRVGMMVLFALVLLLFAGFFMINVRRTINISPLPEFELNYQYQTPKVSQTPAIWSVGIEEQFSADVYPSKISAIRSLGYKVAARIQKLRPHIITEAATISALTGLIEDQRSRKLISGIGAAMRESIAEKKVNLELGEIVANIPVDRLVNLALQSSTQTANDLVIKLVQDEHERVLLEELRESIIDVIDDCRCVIVRRSSDVDTEREEIGVSLEIDTIERTPRYKEPRIIVGKGNNYTMVFDLADKPDTGSATEIIEARIFSENYDRRGIEVRFAEKPWVENFADYLNRLANTKPQQQVIRARSSETCFSVEEAFGLALKDAAQRVTSFLIGIEGDHTQVLPEDLFACDMIADQFAQSFKGSEGQVWRQALLVDVSKPKLQQLISIKSMAQSKQRRNFMFYGVSFLGMMGIICLLYALANAATKGYYSTVLRLFTVVIVIATVTGLVLALRIM